MRTRCNCQPPSDGQPVRQSSRVMTPLIVFSLLCVVPAKATNCTGRLRPRQFAWQAINVLFFRIRRGKTWGPCSRPLTVHPTDSGPAGRKTSKSFARRGSWAAEPNYGTLKCWPAFTPTCYRQHGLGRCVLHHDTLHASLVLRQGTCLHYLCVYAPRAGQTQASEAGT